MPGFTTYAHVPPAGRYEINGDYEVLCDGDEICIRCLLCAPGEHEPNQLMPEALRYWPMKRIGDFDGFPADYQDRR